MAQFGYSREVAKAVRDHRDFVPMWLQMMSPQRWPQVTPVHDSWRPEPSWDGKEESRHNGQYASAHQALAEDAFFKHFDIRKLTKEWHQNPEAPTGKIWWEPNKPHGVRK